MVLKELIATKDRSASARWSLVVPHLKQKFDLFNLGHVEALFRDANLPQSESIVWSSSKESGELRKPSHNRWRFNRTESSECNRGLLQIFGSLEDTWCQLGRHTSNWLVWSRTTTLAETSHTTTTLRPESHRHQCSFVPCVYSRPPIPIISNRVTKNGKGKTYNTIGSKVTCRSTKIT